MISRHSSGTGDKKGPHPRAWLSLLDAYTQDARCVRSVSDGTLTRQRRYLLQFFEAMGGADGKRLLARLSARRVQHFVFQYRRIHGPGAALGLQKSLRGFFGFCHRHGHTPNNLAAAVPVVRQPRLGTVPRGIDPASALALMHDLDERGRSAVRDAAVVCLLNTYGVRGVQVRRLRLDEIDWEAHRICFPAVKGGRPVEQVLTPEAGNRLLAYLRDARPPVSCREVFLTTTPPYRALRAASSLSAIIGRRLRQAGIRLPAGVSRGTHSFRHAFASRLVGQVPLPHLSDLLGHRDPSSTLIYTKINFKALQEAALPWPEES